MKYSRREFNKLMVLSLVTLSTSEASEGGRSFLRPPGALDEERFLERCIRCQRCIQVCPKRVIFPLSFAEGIKRMNTPAVTFKKSYCNSCLKCSQVCPTGALLPVTEATLDIGVAVIIEKDCVAWDWVGCTVCVDECPEKAIYLDEHKRPVIEPEKCSGCGICELKCPSTSIRKSAAGKGILVKPRQAGTLPRDPSLHKKRDTK